MEGADPVLSPDQVQEWYDAGLRIIGPAHYGVSPYAHGTGTEGGLFPPGQPLLKEMERVGMILDVTHLSDQCFDEALDIYGGPVLASHHNCRALVPDQRQLTDDQIKRLIRRGAVIGAALDTWMLAPGWVRGKTQPKEADVSLETYVDHIDRVCQLAGNAQHAAIGTDLDGGFGSEQSPHDLDTIADLQRVPALLRKRGYTEADVKGIMHGNWVRFFKDGLETLGESDAAAVALAYALELTGSRPPLQSPFFRGLDTSTHTLTPTSDRVFRPDETRSDRPTPVPAGWRSCAGSRPSALDPWGGRFDGHQPIEHVLALPADLPEDQRPRVGIAGRIVSRRDQGQGPLPRPAGTGPASRRCARPAKSKASDEATEFLGCSSQVQVMIGQKQVGETGWALAQELDLGDLIGVDGTFGKTKTGEPTIFADEADVPRQVAAAAPRQVRRHAGRWSTGCATATST